MLLNHERQTPRNWDDAIPSLCPDCNAPLTPRRGHVVVWHWAHRAATQGGSAGGCTTTETQWHLLWKAVYQDFPKWEIEVSLTIDGMKFRLDAANISALKAREFVHSLSDSYVVKHLALRRSGLDVLWIFDGDEFAAARRKRIRRGGIKHLLKPKARWLHSRVGGLVHFDGRLWREWRSDCWYPAETGIPATLAVAFEDKLQKLRACGRLATAVVANGRVP